MKSESFASMRRVATLILAYIPISGSASAPDLSLTLASIDDTEISREEFEREVYITARQTFYHGKLPSGDDLVEFRKRVAEDLVARHLLVREARRRGIDPDHDEIETRLARYEVRNAGTERWEKEGAQALAELRSRYEEDSLLELLEASIRQGVKPDITAVKVFYEDNPELFTEPSQTRVSVIVLGVAPSAGAAAWQAARDEAQRILEKLEDGAAFDELARMHSSDMTAQAGGDMGFVHDGSLNSAVEAAIKPLDIGEVSEAVTVLEGIAIFKLMDRRPPRLHHFDAVEERASDLCMREQGQLAWDELIASLRSDSDVSIDMTYLEALPGTGE
jgi:parvulin-like peptidyl-prolyl isomerase